MNKVPLCGIRIKNSLQSIKSFYIFSQIFIYLFIFIYSLSYCPAALDIKGTVRHYCLYNSCSVLEVEKQNLWNLIIHWFAVPSLQPSCPHCLFRTILSLHKRSMLQLAHGCPHTGWAVHLQQTNLSVSSITLNLTSIWTPICLNLMERDLDFLLHLSTRFGWN